MSAYLGTNTALAKIQALQQAPWYPLSSLADTLTLLQGLNFAIQANRTQALQMINDLPATAPYGVGLDNDNNSTTNIRFAPGKQFVCSSLAPYRGLFQQLTAAVSFKERTTEKTMLSNSQAPNAAQNTATPSPSIIISNYNDASQAYYNSVSNIVGATVDLNAVFDQATFEKEFNVTWGNPTFRDAHGVHGEPVTSIICYGDYKPHIERTREYVFNQAEANEIHFITFELPKPRRGHPIGRARSFVKTRTRTYKIDTRGRVVDDDVSDDESDDLATEVQSLSLRDAPTTAQKSYAESTDTSVKTNQDKEKST